jgi:hypothetical protein
VKSGAQRVHGGVERRGSEASADNRCLMVGTGLLQCPVGQIATKTRRCEDEALSSVQQVSRQGTCTRQAGLDLGYVIVELCSGLRLWLRGCNFVEVTTPNLTYYFMLRIVWDLTRLTFNRAH